MARRTRVGINVNTRAPLLYPKDYSVEDVLKLSKMVEDYGYDSVWVGDSQLSKPRLEPLSMLAAMACVTNRVRIGTADLISPPRHPVLLAQTWSTLEILSKGRMVLVLGVGGGGRGPGFGETILEFENLGVPYGKRGSIMEEQIEVLRKLWTLPIVNYDGKIFKLRDVAFEPKPVQKPSPPIWVASNPHIIAGITEKVVERMFRRVARLCDGWMSCTATPEEYVSSWGRILQYAREYGRDSSKLTAAQQVTLTINDDVQEAKKEGNDFLNRYYFFNCKSTDENPFWKRDPFGDADIIIKNLDGLISAGVREFIIRFGARDQFSQLEKFTKEVLPSL